MAKNMKKTAKQSLNSRSRKIECNRLLNISVGRTYGGTLAAR